LRKVKAMALSASPEGLTTMTDALSAKARKLSPGLEDVKDLPSDPWFAAGVSTAPLTPDAAYIGLVLPAPGDMRVGRLVNDDEEGRDGDIRV
jgi:hypothetical protein